MINRNFILNIDNFGLSNEYNQAVLEGYNNGFITNTHICVNTEAYENAINNILPDCPNLGVGLLLNIITGKSLTKCFFITDSNGNFNKNLTYYILNRKKQKILNEIEQEFRAQIEKNNTHTQKVSSIATLAHIHAIPEIFEIVCKLAKEYNILYVRTHFEEIYFSKNTNKHFSINYIKNMFQLILFRQYSEKNRILINKYGLKTNNNILGIAYNSMMDAETIEQGLQILDEDCTVEAIIHPKKFNNSTKNWHTFEFEITQDFTLKDTITRLGFKITNYKNL